MAAISRLANAAPWPGKRVAGLLGAAFLIDVLTIFLVFAWGNSYLLEDLHAPLSTPGYALAVYGLVKLAAAPPGGWLLGRLGARGLALAATGLQGAGVGLGALLASPAGFMACVALLAAGAAWAWLAVFRRLAEAHPAESAGRPAWLLSASSGAAGASAFALAPLFAITGPERGAFAFAAALVAGQALLLRGGAPGPRIRAAAGRGTHWRTLLTPAAALIFAHFAVTAAAVAVVVPLLLRVLSLSLAHATLAAAPAALAAACALFWAGTHTGRSLRPVLATLYGLAAIALATLAPATSAVAAGLALVPLAGGLAGAAPLVNALVLRAAGRESGERLGWLFFAEGLGAVVGPASTALVIDLAGVRWASAGVGAAVAVLAISLAFSRWRPTS